MKPSNHQTIKPSNHPAAPAAGLSRRDFLFGGAAFGGLVAAASLPTFADDDPSLFPGRGRFERLSLGYQHINAGATKPFSILHISDTHLTEVYPDEPERLVAHAKRRIRTFGGRQAEALRDSLSWAKQHVDYVIHTGDLIDFASRANMDLAHKFYGDFGPAMFGSLGNHEFYDGQPRNQETDEHKKRLSAALSAAYPFDISFSSTVVNGVNFITLDNVYGTYTDDQKNRFAEEVKKGLPIILCMHCPISSGHIWRATTKFWKRTDLKGVPDASKWNRAQSDFVAYLKAQPLLKALLTGHLHIDIQERFSPTAMQYVVGGNFLFHGQEITIT